MWGYVKNGLSNFNIFLKNYFSGFFLVNSRKFEEEYKILMNCKDFLVCLKGLGKNLRNF